MHELPLLQIGLAVLALKLLPESWIMRVTLPLFSQLLDLLFSNLTVISLNQLCLHLSALDARLGCLGAEDSGEVWNVARAPVFLQVNVLAEATALTAIFSLVVLSTADSHLHFRDRKRVWLGQCVGAWAVASLAILHQLPGQLPDFRVFSAAPDLAESID